MIIAIIVLVIALAGSIYLCYEGIEESIKLQNKYDNLRREHENLQEKYKVMKKRKNISYWFSLLRNPDRDKIEIARTVIPQSEILGIEAYTVSNFDFNYMYAKMYGNGHIDSSFITDSTRGANKEFHGEPHSKEELKFFFGDRADWLWSYYEYYRDFVKVREHPVSKIQTQKEIQTHVGKNPDNEVTTLLRRLSKGACIYLSGAIVLETVKHKGQKCLEVSGLEGEYRQEVLYRGGKWIDIDGKEYILVEKNTALISVTAYLLEKFKVLNIYDTPVREL